ncbi:spermidine/putrescine transport system substrate-binding protein [Rhizobium sp. SG_E_25_P2]|uniref:extracellular solute-binding protein n=1 Tax=Rhizobium sp. SG_E_25_P2 TaxID=2879942 RepID=UPI0024732CCD|nr:extracellular solute-binding protein [Rhizobium sp. SG_E_25_P2]MDH6265894.1 spermidine/putrescine transport system substrate-binding protein [Rhizobium sp. SG_E_25_P2]
MKYAYRLAASTAILAAVSFPALAEGQLNIYNFGLYTPPDLIKKFEKTYDVKVSVTEYDSNETAMAKIEAGGHGFDIVVPSASVVPIYIEKGLLMKSEPNQMSNFKNVNSEWVGVDWDAGRHYTVPWVWGTTGVMVNTKIYKGDINTSAVIFDPPEELKGKINVVPSMNDVIDMAIGYVGGQPCTDDKTVLKAARDKLMAAKPYWASIDYASFEKFIKEDLQASVFWSGATMRIRAENPGFAYGYPKEGYALWQDNAAILADARNVDNAKLFLNFIMDPENAALISNYTRYGNAIAGSEKFMDPELPKAPEMNIPPELKSAGFFQKTCPADVQQIYTKIWTELTK